MFSEPALFYSSSIGLVIFSRKKFVKGPMQKAVNTVPIPTVAPKIKPISTQKESVIIRQNLNGTTCWRSDAINAHASYADTPRSAEKYKAAERIEPFREKK